MVLLHMIKLLISYNIIDKNYTNFESAYIKFAPSKQLYLYHA